MTELPESETAAAQEEPAAEQSVHVTCQAAFAGRDMLEVHRVVRGELGEPNLPVLPELPERGVWSTALARSTTLLGELGFDLQPHGWRVGVRDGIDARRARSMLRSDENLLADVLGTEKAPSRRLKVSLLGPWTLAASLYLSNGERVIADHGARRDVIQAYAEGIGQWLGRLRRNTTVEHFTVQLDESLLPGVLDGAIPTASGYRTLRSVPRHEAREALAGLVAAVDAGHRVSWLGQLPQDDAGWRDRVDLVDQAGIGSLVFNPRQADYAQWERIAALVETGGRLYLQALAPGERPAGVVQGVKDILRPWRTLGLPLRSLSALRLMPVGDFSASSAAQVIDCLQSLAGYAQGLEQTRVDA